MISAIIIDDELNAREFLMKLLARYFAKKIVVVATCDSVKDGVEAIKIYNPEMVFLDIQMPNEKGFELFKYFNPDKFEVIFTTAYDKYAINAIRHSALDYLLKPINYIDLLSSIKRFEKRKNDLNQKAKIELLLENMDTNNSSFNKIALPTQNGFELIKLNNIIYCTSDSNYCKIVCNNNKEILVSKTLKYVEELIVNELFVRIHKSFLVNLNYVVKFDKGDELKVTLANGEQLPVSVRKKEHFLNAILHKS
jgi:two-component system LytT family response regulator